MFVSIYYKPSLFNAHTMILIVHIFMTVNKLCLNQPCSGLEGFQLARFIIVTECIVCVSGYDPLTFSFLSFLFFDWVGVLWPQLSKV